MKGPTNRQPFGQHFLSDEWVIEEIVRLIDPRSDQHLVEIGPGAGALTGPLLRSGCRLDVIEIDKRLAEPLARRYAQETHFNLHVADAVKFDLSQIATGNRSIRVVGNLPYNVSTPLLMHCFEHIELIEDMVFMLQKEVVDRLIAVPGSRDYGRLTIATQVLCEVNSRIEVPPAAFSPPPRVDSAVIKLVPLEERPSATVLVALQHCVKIAFSQRRKTIRNTLGKSHGLDLLRRCGIDPSARAENLCIDDYLRLSNTWLENRPSLEENLPHLG